MLYGTTDGFLKEFGFETLRDLPDIQDIEGVLDDEEDAPETEEDILMTEQISIKLPDKE